MARQVAEPDAELLELLHRSPAIFTAGIRVLIAARARGLYDEAFREPLEIAFGQTMTLADLLGRARLLDEAEQAAPEVTIARAASLYGLALAATPIVPEIPFEQAIGDIVDRQPMLAPTWEAVAELYQTEHAFALARSADELTTEKVQGTISKMLEEGVTLETAQGRIMEALGDWSASYAETVYRTNLNTAYSAGRFQQAFDPDVRQVIGAFEFMALEGDPDTRPNHAAADGLIASQDDEIWDQFAPPLGYNCRCTLRLVPRSELIARDLVREDGSVIRTPPPGFSRAHPDQGFGGGRPDRKIYMRRS